MAKITPNLRLQKPDYDDSADIMVVNGDMDILDNNYGKVGSAINFVDDLADGNVTASSIIADHATVGSLDATYASIETLQSDYITANEIDAQYAQVNLANANNAWIENGVIRNGAIRDAQILDVSANKMTAGTLDAGRIRVINLNAENLIVKTINGLPVIGGDYMQIDPSSEGYASKNPSAEGWFERVAGNSFALSADTVVAPTKVYYMLGTTIVSSKDYVDTRYDELSSRIDGTIQTWTGSDVPTLLNYPASSWYDDSTTPPTDTRGEHIGDIYFVVNSASEADGFSYRFVENSGQYEWIQIRDSDITDALSRITDLEAFESSTATWIDSTDEYKATTTANITSLTGVVGTSVASSVQLWFTQSGSASEPPSPPSEHVTSASTAPNAWTTVVPEYSAAYPRYYYCYEYRYARTPDDAGDRYGWSAVIRDLAMEESQSVSRDAKGTADRGVREAVQLWYVKSGDSLPAVPQSISEVSDSASVTNTWTKVVPVYNSGAPNYFYCYQYLLANGNYSWSEYAVFDRATSEAMATAKSAIGGLATKVEVETFNTLEHTVDANSADITKLTTTTRYGGMNLLPVTESTCYSESKSAMGVTVSYDVDGWFRVSGVKGAPIGTETAVPLWLNGDGDYLSPVNQLVPQSGGEDISMRVESSGSAFVSGSDYNTSTHIAVYLNSVSSMFCLGGFEELEYHGSPSAYISKVVYHIGRELPQNASVDGRFRIKLERGLLSTAWAYSYPDETYTSNRVSSVEQTIDGITTRIGNVESEVATKADGSTVTTIRSDLNETMDTVAGHTSSITSITDAQTEMQDDIAGSAASTVQVWFASSGGAPQKPSQHVTSNSAGGGAWRTVVPEWDAAYPNYYYCYETLRNDGSYRWTDPVPDSAMGASRRAAQQGIADAANALSVANGSLKSSIQLWRTGAASAAAPSAPTGSVPITSSQDAPNVWTTVVPTYDAAYPNYYYCWQYISNGNVPSWSAVVLDKAVTDSQGTSRSASAKADSNVARSGIIWYTSPTLSAPQRPQSWVDTSAVDVGGVWTTAIPNWRVSHQYYYTCMQQETAGGAYSCTTPTYDGGLSSALAIENSSTSTISSFVTEYGNFKQTVREFEVTVGETYAEKSEVSSMNLSPFFSHALPPIGASSDDYWQSCSNTAFSVLGDGWAHFEYGPGSAESTYFSTLPQGFVMPSTDYTVMVEVRGISVSGTGDAYMRPHRASSNAQIVGDSSDIIDFNSMSDGTYRFAVRSKDDIIGSTMMLYSDIYVGADVGLSLDLRVSMYGISGYKGLYLPYVDQTLSSRVGSAETSIRQNTEDINLRATKTEVIQQRPAYASCSTGAGMVAKVATIEPAVDGYALFKGASVAVTFANGSTAANPTLNVNGSGAKGIRAADGSALTSVDAAWSAGTAVNFVYDGSYWRMTDSGLSEKLISYINISPEEVTISANKVNIAGAAIFQSGGAYDMSTTVVSSQPQWYSSTSAGSRVGGAWSALPPSVAAGRYIWQREFATYADGHTAYLPSENGACIQGQTDLSDYSTTGDMNSAISSAVDGISVGGRNLFAYADSEKGYMTASGGDANQSASKELRSKYIPVDAGGQYTLQYWGDFAASPSANQGWLCMQWYASDKSFISQPIRKFYTETVHESQVYTAPSNAAYARVSGRWLDPGFAIESRLKFEKGNKATDWTPAPEDTQKSIDDLSSGVSDAKSAADGAISRSQRIYYRAASAGAPAKNLTWLSSSGTGYGSWSLSVPSLTDAGNAKYPYLYTAVQSQTVSQHAAGTACSCSDVLLDDTATVIDGGSIITGSVTANAIAANAITTDKVNFGDFRMPTYGTCPTAANVAAKVVDCDNFSLNVGSSVTVRFSNANTSAGALTLNVNSTGAKPIWSVGAATSDSNSMRWGAGTEVMFTYDGTAWRAYVGQSAFSGECATAHGTAAKTASVPGFVCCRGTKLSLRMAYRNTSAAPTLNVSGTGAVALVANGAASSSDYARPTVENGLSWMDGEIQDFVFDGKVWRMSEIPTYQSDGLNLLNGMANFSGLDNSDGCIWAVAISQEPPLQITSQPENLEVASATSQFRFTVVTNDSGASYQWQTFNPAADSPAWANSGISGNKNATFEFNGNTARLGYRYRCHVTFSDGSHAYSQPVFAYLQGGDGTSLPYEYSPHSPFFPFENAGELMMVPVASKGCFAKAKVNYLDYSNLQKGYYTLSFESYEDTSSLTANAPFSVRIGFNPISGYGDIMSDAADRYIEYSDQASVSGGWSEHSVSFILDDSLIVGSASALAAGSNLTVQFARAAGTAPLRVRNIKLEKGNTSSVGTQSISDSFSNTANSVQSVSNELSRSMAEMQRTTASISESVNGLSVDVRGIHANVDGTIKNVNTVFEFSENGLTIKTAEKAGMRSVFNESSLKFYSGDDVVLELDAETSTVRSDRMRMGGYQWMVSDNGRSLALAYVGGD